jgi:endonuclease YncB( thermonuclease family)
MAFLPVALGTTRAADDADTLTVEGVRFRLDGIDAPELDQPCLDSAGEVYFCGRKAYEELQKFIAKRELRCDDKGPDSRRQNRRIGQCSVENVDLQRWLVTNGWAIPFEPYAKGRFKHDEVDARGLRAGLWDGCFVAPQDFRYWRKSSATLLGMAYSADARDKLFPDDPRMPQGWPIKGKLAYRAWPMSASITRRAAAAIRGQSTPSAGSARKKRHRRRASGSHSPAGGEQDLQNTSNDRAAAIPWLLRLRSHLYRSRHSLVRVHGHT